MNKPNIFMTPEEVEEWHAAGILNFGLLGRPSIEPKHPLKKLPEVLEHSNLLIQMKTLKENPVK